MVIPMYQSFEQNKNHISEMLHVDQSFDIVSRNVLIGEKNAVFYFIDGFCQDALMQKLLQPRMCSAAYLRS